MASARASGSRMALSDACRLYMIVEAMKIDAPIFRVIFDSRVRVHSAVNSRGQTLADACKQKLYDSDFKCTLVKGAWRTDDVLNSTGCEFVVSARALELIVGEFHLPDFVVCREAAICDRNGRSLAKYFILDQGLKDFDIISRDQSDLRMIDGVIVHVGRLVAEETRVPSFDLFPIVPVGWIASAKAVGAFQREKISGLQYQQIAVTRGGGIGGQAEY